MGEVRVPRCQCFSLDGFRGREVKFRELLARMKVNQVPVNCSGADNSDPEPRGSGPEIADVFAVGLVLAVAFCAAVRGEPRLDAAESELG